MTTCTICGAPTEWDSDEPPLCVRCFDAQVEMDEAERMSAVQKASRDRRKQIIAAYQHEYWINHRRKGIER